MGCARRRSGRLVLLAAMAALVGACGYIPQNALDPAGPFARQPHELFMVVFWIAVGVFVLVQTLIIVAVVRFRRRPGDDTPPAQVHGNTRLEVVWTVIPALILAGLAVPTVRMIFELDTEPAEALQVEVIGHRWWFEYRYPDHDIVTANELVIPVDTPVRLSLTAEEAGSAAGGVIHSFWIPRLAGTADMLPGTTTVLNLEADAPGRYLGACKEYCGLSHANMRARAVALTAEDFQAWVENQQAPPVEPEEGTLAAQGRQLFVEDVGGQACASCHAIEGISEAVVGPNLTHLMSRREFAGAVFDLYERNAQGEFTDEPNVDLLTRWVDNPPALKPMRPALGVGMPDLNLTPDEVEALVAYMITLE